MHFVVDIGSDIDLEQAHMVVASVDKTAVEALYDAIMAEDEVILVPTGSYTNIALLFSEYPEVKSHIKKIVAMGGSVSGGNMTSAAEFNVFTDPDAARIMYNSGIPIVMVGLDVTLKALLTKDTIEKLGQSKRRRRKVYFSLSRRCRVYF